MKYGARRLVGTWIGYLLLLITLLFIFFPFLWLLITSLKYPIDAFSMPPKWIFKPTAENYLDLTEAGFVRSYLNTVIIALSVTAVSLLLGAPAGYSLARAKFRGKDFMSTWVLLVRLAPPVAFIIPMYILYRALRITDSYPGLVIAYLTFTLPFVLWIMSGFYRNVPVELEEAAIIDGCSRLGALIRVVIPVSTPGIATAIIFSLVMSWNEFFYPLILGGRRTMTAPLMISGFVTYSGPNWGKLAAAGIMVVAPVLIFTVLAQKGIVRGLMRGSIK